LVDVVEIGERRDVLGLRNSRSAVRCERTISARDTPLSPAIWVEGGVLGIEIATSDWRRRTIPSHLFRQTSGVVHIPTQYQADDLRSAQEPPAATRRHRPSGLDGRPEGRGVASREEGVTVTDRPEVMRVAAAQDRQAERPGRRRRETIAPLHQQTGVEGLDRVEGPLGFRPGGAPS
jgi:hypothetical protein